MRDYSVNLVVLSATWSRVKADLGWVNPWEGADAYSVSFGLVGKGTSLGFAVGESYTW